MCRTECAVPFSDHQHTTHPLQVVIQETGFTGKPLGLKLDDNAIAFGAALLFFNNPLALSPSSSASPAPADNQEEEATAAADRETANGHATAAAAAAEGTSASSSSEPVLIRRTAGSGALTEEQIADMRAKEVALAAKDQQVQYMSVCVCVSVHR